MLPKCITIWQTLFYIYSIATFVVCGVHVNKTTYYVLGSVVLALNVVPLLYRDSCKINCTVGIIASSCNLVVLYLVGHTLDEKGNGTQFLVLQTAYTVVTVLYATIIGWPPYIEKNIKGEPIQGYLKTEAFCRLVIDYALSASVMLSVISLLWGCRSYAGIIVGPLLLWGALVASWYVLNRTCSTDITLTPRIQYAHLVHLLLVYGAALLPLMGAVYNGLKPSTTELPTGEMPVWVAIIAIANMLLFSVFVVPYVLDLRAKKYVCFVSHAVLSVIAKVILHAFLGISILAQVNELSDSECTKERGADNQLGRVFGVIGGTIAGGCCLAWVLRCINPLKEERDLNDVPAKFFQVHIVCGVMHLISLSVLLYTALQNSNGDLDMYTRRIKPRFWEFDTWYYKCFDQTSSTCYITKGCEEANRHYYIPNDGTTQINVVLLASVYVIVSGLTHIMTALVQYVPVLKCVKDCST